MTIHSSRKWLALFVVQLATLLNGLDMIVNTLALPTLSSHFQSSLSFSQWILSGYYIVTAMMLPILGRLADLFSRKFIFIFGFLIYGLGGMLAFHAPSIELLIFFRLLQGIGMAALLANANVMIISIFPSHEHGIAIGMNGATYSLGFILGNLLGGYLIGALGWPSIYILGFIVAFLGALSGYLILKEKNLSQHHFKEKKITFDYIGSLLSIVFIATFLLGLKSSLDNSVLNRIPLFYFTLSILTLGGFVFYERKFHSPLLEMGLLKKSIISKGLLIAFVIQSIFASVLVVIPFFLQIILRLDTLMSGVIMMPFAIAFLIFGPYGGKLANRWGFRLIASAGFVLLCLGLWIISSIHVVPAHIAGTVMRICLGLSLIGISLGFVVFPNNKSVLNAVPFSHAGSISGFIWVMTVFGYSVGTTYASSVMNNALKKIGMLKDIMLAQGALDPQEITTFLSHQSYFIRKLALFSLIGLLLAIFKNKK